MSASKIKDTLSGTIEELKDKEIELRKELYELRVQVLAGRIEKPHRIKQIKRDIARLKTVLKEKKNVQK